MHYQVKQFESKSSQAGSIIALIVAPLPVYLSPEYLPFYSARRYSPDTSQMEYQPRTRYKQTVNTPPVIALAYRPTQV